MVKMMMMVMMMMMMMMMVMMVMMVVVVTCLSGWMCFNDTSAVLARAGAVDDHDHDHDEMMMMMMMMMAMVVMMMVMMTCLNGTTAVLALLVPSRTVSVLRAFRFQVGQLEAMKGRSHECI